MIRSKRPMSNSANGADVVMPALLTIMLMSPKSCSTASATLATAALSETSQTYPRHSCAAGIIASVASMRDCEVPITASLQPLYAAAATGNNRYFVLQITQASSPVHSRESPNYRTCGKNFIQRCVLNTDISKVPRLSAVLGIMLVSGACSGLPLRWH